jgi:hypothetical protein
MIEHIYRGARIACASVVLLLAACGGGGGGGGAPDPSSAPGITVAPTSLSFAAVHNGALPPTQSVSITISAPNAVFIGAAFPGAPSWLDESQGRLTGGGNTWTFTAAITSTTLTPGTYTTTLQIGIADANQNLIAFRNIQISYTITATPVAASPNSLNFTYVVGAPAPAAQQTTLMGDTNTFIGSADQPWIHATPSGVVPGTATISVNPTGLTPNLIPYTGTVTFISGTSLATVSVSLTVSAPDIQSSQASLSFSGINGATIASQPLAITMNNGASLSWTASTPLADTWLVLDRTIGTQGDTLNVSVHPENGSLASASGPFSSTITLTGSSGGSPFNKTVNVTLTLTKATLTSSLASVTLGGTNGRDFSGVPVQLSLNTGTNSFSWNSTASSFIQRLPSLGSVSATPVSVMLTPNAAGLTGGTHSGSVTFATQVNGDTVSVNVPVTFNQESHKLLVDGNGVGFAKTPTLSNLTRTLKVRDNLGLPTSWTASTDQNQPWLTVTGSGIAGDDLVLTVNPATLTTDNLYLATVTIASADTTVENTETVRVGFWVGLADPNPTDTVTGLQFTEVAADPIRPYAYVSDGGTSVQIYNVYLNSPLSPILNVAGQVGPMTVSHDGSILYAVDLGNATIVPVNLDTLAVGTPFPYGLSSPPKSIDYGRTNGKPLIVLGNGRIFDATTGTQFDPLFVSQSAVAVSRDGSRMCFTDISGGSGAIRTSCPTLDFTSLNGGQLLFGDSPIVDEGDLVNASDIAVSVAGTVDYVAAGTPNTPHLGLYATEGLASIGAFAIEGRGNNVEIAPDGRIFAGSTNVFVNQTADVRVFDAAGNLLTTRLIAPGPLLGGAVILDRQMKVSGDGLRLITITGVFVAPSLIFTTVAP